MPLLEGKRILVTGVLTRQSIAYHVAERAQREGAEVLLTSFGRARSLTERSAKRLPAPPPVIDLDINDPDHLSTLAERVRAELGGLDGALHAIAFAPEDALGGNFMHTPEASAIEAFRTSAYSFKAMGKALLPLLGGDVDPHPGAVGPRPGASLVGLDFDATLAWPIYDWMGVAKASLEAVSRYMARDLGPRGVRVNLIAAGPLQTVAAKAIPGFRTLADAWRSQAPLGWDAGDPAPVAAAVCFLLSDLAGAITGEILHVDGGFHAIGAAAAPA